MMSQSTHNSDKYSGAGKYMQNYQSTKSPSKGNHQYLNKKQQSLPVDDDTIEMFTTSKEKSKVNKYYNETHKMEDYKIEKRFTSDKGIPKFLN